MTLNHKNTPNCRLIALTWARIKAGGGGRDCAISADNREEVEINDNQNQENPHPDPRLGSVSPDAGHRGWV